VLRPAVLSLSRHRRTLQSGRTLHGGLGRSVRLGTARETFIHAPARPSARLFDLLIYLFNSFIRFINFYRRRTSVRASDVRRYEHGGYERSIRRRPSVSRTTGPARIDPALTRASSDALRLEVRKSAGCRIDRSLRANSPTLLAVLVVLRHASSVDWQINLGDKSGSASRRT